jgi:hypothetical protein
MDETCSMHGSCKRVVQMFGHKNRKESDCLEDLCVDGRIISKWGVTIL